MTEQQDTEVLTAIRDTKKKVCWLRVRIQVRVYVRVRERGLRVHSLVPQSCG